MWHKRVACWVVVVAVGSPAWAEVINVPADFPTIQEAIDAASDDDEIVVAPGNYNEPIDFLGKSIVVRSSNGPEATTLDGTGLFTSVVKIVSGEGPSTELDGFTVANGSAPGVDGAGLRILGSPTILNCQFRNNVGQSGGAVLCEGAALFQDCTFNSNEASTAGAMFVNGPTTITGCTFISNNASAGGGAMYVFQQATIANCTFISNTGNGGGALRFNRDDSVVRDCFFCENQEPVIFGPFTDGGGNEFAEVCPDSMGACCIGRDCIVVTSEACDAAGGDFQGVDTRCEDVECLLPEDTGACCVNGGCAVTTFAECEAIGGEYQGKFTICEEVECPPLPTAGACCINGGCLVLTIDECATAGGAYRGDDVLCQDVECSRDGACCLLDACVEVSLDECFAAGGSFAGVASECGNVECPEICLGDLIINGEVDFNDLLVVLSNWGPCP